MNRLPASLSVLSAAVLLAVGANAQCYTSSGSSIAGSFVPLLDPDEAETGPLPLGFTFTMAGSAAITLDHFIVTTNGELFLTDSVSTGYIGTAMSSYANIRGTVGECPRIAAYATDLDSNGPGVWDVKVDSVAGVSTKVTWENVGEWLSAENYSFSVTINASGTIQFDYSATDWTGAPDFYISHTAVSAGNSVGPLVGVPADLSAPASSASGIIYQDWTFGGAFDLAGSSILFTPAGAGWNATAAGCAFHEAYGSGCYDGQEAIYAVFADSPASLPLQGQSMQFIPNGIGGFGDGYTIIPGGVTYRAPVTPNLLTLADDSEATITPSASFQHIGGPSGTPIPVLSVNSNGTVIMAPAGSGNDVTIYGDVFALHNDPVAAFRSNRDYNPGAMGSGQVSWEEDMGVLYITWAGVYIFGSTNPETVQFQLDLTGSGNVRLIWQAMDALDNNALVVGYSPGGGSDDRGAKTLPPATSFTTRPDGLLLPLTLSATPAPVITLAGAGPAVLCTYTVSNVPEFDPVNLPGIGAGALLWGLSGSQVPGGFDLGTFPADIGMSGCSAYVFPIAAQVDISGVITGGPGGTLSFSIAMPQPLTPGLEFYLQALCLLPSGTPTAGSNNLTGTPYGARTSNGLIIHYDTQ